MKTKTIFVVIAFASLLGGAFAASLLLVGRPLWEEPLPWGAAAFAALTVYLLPTVTAAHRRSDWLWPAAAINLLLGWSFVGWGRSAVARR